MISLAWPRDMTTHERRLCDEVHLNLAYRWFCRLGLDGDVPDHSTFSKNRHGRFRDSDLLRQLFETVVVRCMTEGLVGGEAFAVDASMVVADAHRQRGMASSGELALTSNRVVTEYLAVLDDAAFGAATPVEPKLISPTDPAARWTAANGGPAVYAYADNYLIDLKHAVIMDVEATTCVRQAEVTAAKTMIERTANRLEVTPSRLAADTGYGSAEMLAFMVDGAPEIAEPAVDFYERLVQMPPPTRVVAHMRRPPPADLGGEHRAKPVPPEPHGLMADVDSALRQEALDIAQRPRVSHNIITTRRMTSGELLKYRNGLLMARSYHGRGKPKKLV